MIIHNNQPIQFNTPDTLDCFCDTTDYKQLVNLNDISQFQIELEPCDDAIELLPDPTFSAGVSLWINSGEWFGEDFTACFDTPSATGILSQDILCPNNYYKFSIEVLEVELGGTLSVFFGLNNVGVINRAGSYSFYGFNDDTNNFLKLEATGGRICIDNTSMQEINLDIVVALLDEDDNQVVVRYLRDFYTTIPLGGANLNKIESDEFILARQYLTVFFDWLTEALPTGCYKFGVLDNCINRDSQIRIPNGEFCNWATWQAFPVITREQSWTLTPVGTASLDIFDTADEITYLGGVPSDSATAEQTVLNVGTSYNWEINIISITGAAQVQLKYGTTIAGTFTSAGVYSGTTIANNTDLELAFRFDGTVVIEYVRHEVATIDLSFDQDGVDMSYGTHSCTLLINGCNDGDGFNFGFGDTGFTPTLRVHSKLSRAQYPLDRQVEFNSQGRGRTVFFDRKKVKSLTIDRQPEYIHDYLSLLFGLGHFYIESDEHIVEDGEEYFITYDEDFDNLGSVTFNVKVKEDILRNVACIGETGGCVLPPNILLQENGKAVLLEGGEFILITP